MVPLLLTTAAAFALVWLNRSPWWGWALAMTLLAIVAGVIGSLVVDVLVVARSRLPYASDTTLPPPPTDD
jgi:hypothetical protein